jgi:putative DNA primase/helicase
LPLQLLDLITSPSQGTSDEKKESGIIHEGQRNSALASLGGAMRRKGASEQLIYDALHVQNRKKCRPPLSDREVDSIVRSVARYPSVATARWLLTDVGNARALVAVHGSDLKYVPGLGWFEWDGCTWSPDDTGAVVRSAKALVDTMLAHAVAIPDEANRVKAVKWALSSQSVSRIAAMVKLAESEVAAVVRSDRLDSNPWLLNVLNGTLDLRTGELREHRRDDLLTRVAPVAYDPSAKCPTWDAFLDRVMAGNRDLISYLQRAVGYSLTGNTDEQCFFLLYGTGSNGKSTFLETLVSLIGRGRYATAMNFSTLTNRQRQEPSEDIARLRGIRMVTAIESGRGKVFNETLIKQITGSDTIAARLLYKGTFTFRPAFKLFLSANYKPRINDDDYAIWRRVKLVPFDVQIPESERQRDLQDRLQEELSGILNWALDGCAKWRAHGLGDATAVRAATAQYRRAQGALPAFLDQECDRGRRYWVESRELFKRYEEWCAREERNGMTETAFGRELGRMGFLKDRKGPNRTTRRLGVRLKVVVL